MRGRSSQAAAGRGARLPRGGAGDLSDGAPAYGGAYTFHFTEDLGLEASYLRSREHYELLDAIATRNSNLIDVVRSNDNPIQFFTGNVIWSLAYGKVRWMGGAIGRYDFFLSLGGGATVQPGDVGLTGSAGFGMKFYLTQWLALRLDVRDLVHEQKRAALGVEKIVNDITATGGLSVFIPFTN
jgi:outer membrane beta-barrel protein